MSGTSRAQERSLSCWLALAHSDRFGPDVACWSENEKARAYLTVLKRAGATLRVAGLGPALVRLRNGSAEAREDLERLLCRGLRLGDADVLDLLRTSNGGPLLLALAGEMAELCAWLTRYLDGAGVKDDRGADVDEPVEERE